jgi:hypothetical protein
MTGNILERDVARSLSSARQTFTATSRAFATWLSTHLPNMTRYTLNSRLPASLSLCQSLGILSTQMLKHPQCP